MAFLIAVAGWSGSGKTTAVDHLSKIGAGEKIYIGETVLDEIRARGMTPGPASEQLIRLSLREQHGRGALAIRAIPAIKGHLDRGTNVLVDAIFDPEERRCFEKSCPKTKLVLLAIEACFESRAGRVLTRIPRPLTLEQLLARDNYEFKNLGTDIVITEAHFKLENEGSIDEFHNGLSKFWAAVKSTK